MKNFVGQVKGKNKDGKVICVGLDIDPEKIPESLYGEKDVIEMAKLRPGILSTSDLTAVCVVEFARHIVCATKDLVCAYKINRGFFDAMGCGGVMALRNIVAMISALAPDVPIIVDSKRGDIGNSNKKYLEADVENLPGVNAVTVNPYTGSEDSLDVFLSQEDLGVIALCRTSNGGAREIQDLIVDGEPLFIHVARKIQGEWNDNGNCCVVAGATYPEELKRIREAVGYLPILIPGVGAQGGDLEAVLKNGFRGEEGPVIVNSSRGIIYASSGPDFAEAARKKVEEMNEIVARYLASN